jgi:hypothetical protein
MTKSQKAPSSKKSNKARKASAAAPVVDLPNVPVYCTQYAICVELGEVAEADLAALKTAPQAAVYPHMERCNAVYEEILDLLEKNGYRCRKLSMPTPVLDRGAIVTALPVGVSFRNVPEWPSLAQVQAHFAPKPEPAAPQTPADNGGKGKGKKAPAAAAPVNPDIIAGFDFTGYTDADVRGLFKARKPSKDEPDGYTPPAALKGIKLPKGDLGQPGEARVTVLTAIAAALAG